MTRRGTPLADRLGRGAPYAAVLAAGALAHLTALFNGFIWDDLSFILWNPVLQQAGNIPALFAKPETWGTSLANPYYRPLTMLSFLVDRQLWGEFAAGYHATNVLLHLGVCALLLAALRRLLAPGAALAAALLFAVHPAASEPVAYVSARADLICALFLLASFLAWIRRAETGSRGALALSALAYGAALFAKITAGLFPAVFALHALLIARRRARDLPRDLLPFAAVALGYLAARAAVLEMDTWPSPPLLTRVATAGPLIVRYALMALSPARLSVFHDLAPRTALDGVATASWLLVAGGVAAAAVRARTAPRAALGLAWFLAGVVPVSGLVTLLYPTLAADRYLYLPLAGAVLAAGAALERFGALRLQTTHRRLAVGAAALALLTLAGATTARDRLWRDPIAFWERAALEAPRNQYVLDSLGHAYKAAGRYDDAERALVESLAIRETSETHLQLTRLAFLTNDLGAAASHALRAVELAPASPAALRLLQRLLLQSEDERAAQLVSARALELRLCDPGDLAAYAEMRRQGHGAAAPPAEAETE